MLHSYVYIPMMIATLRDPRSSLIVLCPISDFTMAIDEVTGVMTLARSLDREELPAFTLVITATDQGPGSNTDSVCAIISFTSLTRS